MRGSPAPEIYHLWPEMSMCLPEGSSVREVRMFVASEEATELDQLEVTRIGKEDSPKRSVIANADRISPLRSGISHFFCWSGDPYRASTSVTFRSIAIVAFNG